VKANPPTASPRYQALIQLLQTADIIWNASRVFFEQWDLSPSQFNVLNLLRDSAEGISQTELSQKLIVHRSNVTGLVDRLEKRGWVERREVAGDRRAYRVILTESGWKLLGAILPGYFAGAERVWAKIPEERIRQLKNELLTVARSADETAMELRK
jgi:MarR family 2-MHQ and catechol resistance regulon transcriptional repressor